MALLNSCDVRRGSNGTDDAKSSPDMHRPRSNTQMRSNEFNVSSDRSSERFPSIVCAPSRHHSRCCAGEGGGAGSIRRPNPDDLFLKRFAVSMGDPLRLNGTEAVLRATDWGCPKEISSDATSPPPRAVMLKFLDRAVEARAEIEGRKGVDARYILPILGAIADREAPNLDVAAGKGVGEDIVKVEKRDGLANDICLLLESRQPSTSSHRSREKSSQHHDKFLFEPMPAPVSFRFLLVLDSYSLTLEDLLARGHVDLTVARNVMRDISVGLILLHAERVVHGGVEPRAIVRCENVANCSEWKLAELGSCCHIDRNINSSCAEVERVEGENSHQGRNRQQNWRRNWACQPPEAAFTRLTSGSFGPCPSKLPVPFLPDPMHDLWSLGSVLHHLLRGLPLFLSDDRTGSLLWRDLDKLAGKLDTDSCVGEMMLMGMKSEEGEGDKNNNTSRCAAIDLMTKLLAPTVEERRSNFELGMVSVHKHEFITGKPLELSALEVFLSRQDARRQNQHERASYNALTSRLSLEERWELDRMRDILLFGVFEPRWAVTSRGGIPTSFVILKEKLPRRRHNKAGETRIMSKDKVQRCLEEGLRWIDRLEVLEDSVLGALVGDITCIGHFWNKIGGMFNEDYMYLYFVDELTGEPILDDSVDNDSRGGGEKLDHGSSPYPIEVATWSDVVPCLLPLMHLTMRAMALYHGVAGIARMFGASLSGLSFPKEMRNKVQAKVDRLKSERDDSSAPFGAISCGIKVPSKRKEQPPNIGDNVRWHSMVELVKLLEKKSLMRQGCRASFAGSLTRYSDRGGLSIWTAVRNAEDVKREVRKRSSEFLKEAIQKWDGSKEEEMATLKRDLQAEKAASLRISESLTVSKMKLDKSQCTIDFLQTRIDDLQTSLGHMKQKLAVINKELDNKSTLSKGRSVSLFKKSRKNTRKQDPGFFQLSEINNSGARLKNEI
uniref:Protein kinase domain-containing protein n=1 Tax=Pseudictyota dubia TaxID=2749911 RepID=A0A7R9VGZ9_9STRA